MYHVSIPPPADFDQQLAQIIINEHEHLDISWRAETRQVILRNDTATFIQPNARIVDSLATYFSVNPAHIVAKNLVLFERPNHVQDADTDTAIHFYNCEWSDYAVDQIAIQFELDICTEDTPRRRWEEANRRMPSPIPEEQEDEILFRRERRYIDFD